MSALHIALRNPPINSRNPAIKVQTFFTKNYISEWGIDWTIASFLSLILSGKNSGYDIEGSDII